MQSREVRPWCMVLAGQRKGRTGARARCRAHALPHTVVRPRLGVFARGVPAILNDALGFITHMSCSVSVAKHTHTRRHTNHDCLCRSWVGDAALAPWLSWAAVQAASSALSSAQPHVCRATRKHTRAQALAHVPAALTVVDEAPIFAEATWSSRQPWVGSSSVVQVVAWPSYAWRGGVVVSCKVAWWYPSRQAARKRKKGAWVHSARGHVGALRQAVATLRHCDGARMTGGRRAAVRARRTRRDRCICLRCMANRCAWPPGTISTRHRAFVCVRICS